ncbi:hypothetical protein Tco_0360390 [Tanacetum coccineum]
MASNDSGRDTEYALSKILQMARVTKARFTDQGPATTSTTPNPKPPTSPILKLSGYQKKVSDSSTKPEVAPEAAPEAIRETTTAADTVAKIEETGKFYISDQKNKE